MPALVWCGRRWRTGADDFTFSSALYFSILTVCGVFGLTRIARTEGSWDSSSSPDSTGGSFHIKGCPGASAELGGYFLGLCVVDLIAALFFCITALLSLRGAIFDVSKRSLVPFFLYINAASVVVAAVLTCLGLHHTFLRGEMRSCSRLSHRILVASLSLNVLVCGLFAISLLVVYDPSGRTVYNSPEDYQRTWWKRCRVLCCHCVREEHDDDAFRVVATVLSQAFCAYDMVPSDVAAGLLLLHGYQYHSRRVVRARVKFAPPPPDTGSRAGVPRRERVSGQAVPAKRLTSRERALVRELHRYSRFYMAAYGYLLFEYKSCCTGLPRLCCFDPWMCCRYHSGRHYDTNCFCNVTALLKETGIPEEDLLLTSWSNHMYEPVHYACYDREADAVVIAIRGTMSFIDVATDFAASPEVVELDGADQTTGDGGKKFQPSDFFVHGGMLAAARYVRRSLEYNGVLDAVSSGHYQNANVVVLGHSLGAGTALVLSVLLHSDLPELRGRLRCIAYAPPGGTLSEAVVEYSRDFTMGGFLGYDMIPRLSMHTFDALREAIFDVTAASPIPKSLIYLNAMRTPQVTRTIHPSTATPTPVALSQQRGRNAAAAPVEVTEMVGASAESARYREALRHGSCVPISRPQKLFPCKTLIHFRKAVERSAGAACDACWGEEGCGCCTCCGRAPSLCVEDVYYPCMEGPKDVQMLVAAPTMFSDHMPERFADVLKETVARMDANELERFYQDEEPEELPEAAAPLYYISPTTAAAALTAIAPSDRRRDNSGGSLSSPSSPSLVFPRQRSSAVGSPLETQTTYGATLV